MNMGKSRMIRGEAVSRMESDVVRGRNCRSYVASLLRMTTTASLRMTRALALRMTETAALGALAFAAVLGLLTLTAASGAAQTIAIEGGRVHTMAGAPIDGATVLIRDGRIAEVGLNVTVPAGAQRIDARGKVVTPGFFDSNTNLTLVEVGAVQGTRDFSMASWEGPEADYVAAAFNVADGINPNSVLIPVTRIGGVTTAVARPQGGLISGQAAVVDLEGDDVQDLVVRNPVGMFATLGERSQSAGGGARAGATLRLRQVLDDARFYMRNRDAFNRGETRALAASRLDLEAMLPVLRGEIPFVIEAHRASDIRTALRIANEYDLRLVLLGATEGWMLASEIARAGVPVLVKVLQNLPEDFERLGARYDNAALLREAGVTVAITSSDTHNARNIKQEAGNAVAYGLPYDEALRAITVTPAQIWGVSDTHGTLEAGKVANVVVWGGDPLELLTPVEAVIVDGRAVPMTSRQTELRDRYVDPDNPRRTYEGGR
jgi:imidazolonepropionase-like amidohydrolase